MVDFDEQYKKWQDQNNISAVSMGDLNDEKAGRRIFREIKWAMTNASKRRAAPPR